jgi:GAF domain-containing protein
MMPHRPTRPDRVPAKLGLIKLGETDLAGILDQVAHFAGESLTGAQAVSITILGRDGPYTAASTADIALRLDELQYELLAGPCLQAAADRVTVLVPDTAHDTRWAPWPERAATSGAGSIVSIALPILDDLDGALNVYGRTPGAFDEDAVRGAQNFAEQAAVTLSNAHLYHRTATLAQQMQSAMEYRAVIEQAKGIIIAERRCTPDEAFLVLTRISQESNRKLRDIAAAVVARAQSVSPATRTPRERR